MVEAAELAEQPCCSLSTPCRAADPAAVLTAIEWACAPLDGISQIFVVNDAIAGGMISDNPDGFTDDVLDLMREDRLRDQEDEDDSGFTVEELADAGGQENAIAQVIGTKAAAERQAAVEAQWLGWARGEFAGSTSSISFG